MVAVGKKILLIFAFVVFGFIPVSMVQAESLWTDNSPATSMFGDHRAHAVGDIITILISESTSASRSGKASNSKDSNVSVDAGTGLFKFLNSASAGSSDSFSANGSISNTNKVTAKITAKVMEVRPNGTLVISGTQSVKQNGEEQTITLSGVVRPEDVSADNTIYSTYLSDAKIDIGGNGPLAKKQRQGIITQIFNFLF